MTDQTPITAEFLHRFVPPDPSLPGAVLALTLRDIRLVLERVRDSDYIAEAFGYRDSIRASKEEICEALISSAATASLAGYLRGDDLWRMQICSEESNDGVAICEALDELRAAMIYREKEVRRYVLNPRSQVTAKRSIALLALSLDAVRPAFQPDFQTIAGVSRHSQDVQGDAQDAAETLDLNGQLPLAR